MFTALKPVYDFKTKTFNVQVVNNAEPLLAHEGFLVFDDKVRTLKAIRDGVMVPRWTEAKKKAVVDWLEGQVLAQEWLALVLSDPELKVTA